MNRKGITWLIPIATGLIGVAVGVTLMYLVPPYLISTLNSTGIFTCTTSMTQATTAIGSIQALGLFVVIMSLIWLAIGVVSSGGAK